MVPRDMRSFPKKGRNCNFFAQIALRQNMATLDGSRGLKPKYRCIRSQSKIFEGIRTSYHDFRADYFLGCASERKIPAQAQCPGELRSQNPGWQTVEIRKIQNLVFAPYTSILWDFMF